ncbi:MAG: hypothetical protein L3K06_04225 [Thermoplasmata archaeon]|nr:hypothetical protein [Thermoplasmata archaeon]
MTGISGQFPAVHRAANSIRVAPRMPKFPKLHSGNPFTSTGDVLVDCATPGCGWSCMGPRALVKQAIDEHARQCHSDEERVILLNQPRQ